MLIKLLHWLRGYLLIRMKGQSPERFINLCSNRYIYLWDLKHKEGEYEFRIMLKDYLKLKPIAKKTGTIPFIKKRYGFPFLIHKYKKRKGYLAGILLFCTILYILSLYIWDISVLGGHSYTQEAMLKFLKNNRIYIGLQKKNIDCQEIEELIRGTYNDIGWVSAEIKGTRLIIKITETNMPAPAVTATKNCHIAASKDCIITHIITRTGTPKVKVGSVVKKGDILVSGVVDIIGDNDILLAKKPVIADADVIGKTFYDYKDKIPINYTQKLYTGRSKKGYLGSLLLKKFNLYKPRIPYAKYDIIVNEFMLHLSDNFYLPIGYSVIQYPEYEEIKKKYTKEEVTALANEKLKRFLEELKKKDVLIVENNVKIAIENNTCIASGKIIVQESVKEFKSIDDSEWRIIDTDESNGNDN
ncbi:sporulation protein YqfD [Anaerocolumna sp. AGMB13025]|uniref:sporulation protein YqfD n=1 Tax=Anaerocolumna sp. AGMB13025 TaxID=3039116 RepID=UPI00241DEED4|nr:sporulation protein YqfD [Anaerocolumna sp. AGMB13025]WFR59974.1 sporulation protein YqfD [Anaerocolumna sp. AGMB13025]